MKAFVILFCLFALNLSAKNIRYTYNQYKPLQPVEPGTNNSPIGFDLRVESIRNNKGSVEDLHSTIQLTEEKIHVESYNLDNVKLIDSWYTITSFTDEKDTKFYHGKDINGNTQVLFVFYEDRKELILLEQWNEASKIWENATSFFQSSQTVIPLFYSSNNKDGNTSDKSVKERKVIHFMIDEQSGKYYLLDKSYALNTYRFGELLVEKPIKSNSHKIFFKWNFYSSYNENEGVAIVEVEKFILKSKVCYKIKVKISDDDFSSYIGELDGVDGFFNRMK